MYTRVISRQDVAVKRSSLGGGVSRWEDSRRETFLINGRGLCVF